MELILASLIERNRRRNAMIRNRRILRGIRLIATPFSLVDSAFRTKFRLTKTTAKKLIEKLDPFSKPSCIPFELQVLTALHFYAQGSYQLPIGDNHLLGFSQPSVSRSLKNVTTLIVRHLMGTTIRFPQTLMGKVETQQGFREKFGMRSVLGAVDGTHVPIVSPPKMNDNTRGNLYINRKGYHSINVLACCDSKMRITYANARFPGSVHDSAIWLVSELRCHLRNQFSTVENQESFLIGDSGFPLEPWLLTPFQSTTDGSRELEYNKIHIKTRQIIERCFGVWKNRFRCLMTHRVLHYSPYTAAMIIYATMCLHNMCIEADIYDGDELEIENEDFTASADISQWHNLGEQVRQRFMDTHN